MFMYYNYVISCADQTSIFPCKTFGAVSAEELEGVPGL